MVRRAVQADPGPLPDRAVASAGRDPVAIRYVLARDPEGEQPDAAYFGTDERFGSEEILRYVVQRWSLEVTFEESRAHLGLETQRQGSDLAILRTTPVALGAVLGSDAGGPAVLRGGVAVGRADGVVCQGGADVLGLPPVGSRAALASSNQRHVGGRSRRDPSTSQLR